MADANDGGVGKDFGQALVDGALRWFVQGGGGFVEEEPVWAMQEYARQGDALLFAGGQQLTPVLRFVELVAERDQPDAGQRLAHGFVGEAFGRLRIADGVTQRTNGQVGLLGQHHRVEACRHLEMSLSIGPYSGNGSQKGAFAAPRRSANERHTALGQAEA